MREKRREEERTVGEEERRAGRVGECEEKRRVGV